MKAARKSSMIVRIVVIMVIRIGIRIVRRIVILLVIVRMIVIDILIIIGAQQGQFGVLLVGPRCAVGQITCSSLSSPCVGRKDFHGPHG